MVLRLHQDFLYPFIGPDQKIAAFILQTTISSLPKHAMIEFDLKN